PLPPGPTGLGRLVEDLVVDVGDVAHERHVQVVPVGQPAAQDVEGDAAADVADVRLALHGRPAQIDRGRAGDQWREITQGPGRGVEQTQSHGHRSYCSARAGTISAVATAARPSPRPVKPRPSLVVPETATGPPIAAESTCWASARRGPIFGRAPMTCTAALATVKPASPSSLRTSVNKVTPEAPAHSGRPVPKTSPKSPSPAAESSASHSACAATSPSEWPAQPSTPSNLRPATQHSRPRSIGWTSVPMPTRPWVIAPPA